MRTVLERSTTAQLVLLWLISFVSLLALLGAFVVYQSAIKTK
jgi:hypothetical protein